MNKFLVVFALFSQFTFANGNFPQTVTELKNSAVRIMNPEQTSGGTGSIFKSYSTGSHILTNKHVCELVEQGGVVDHNGKTYLVTHYKKFDQHDLCLVRVATNLGVNLEIASNMAQVSSMTVVSGHPKLLPHIANVGHLSEREIIQLATGFRPCTKKDWAEDPLMCIFMGGVPVIQSFESQVVSNLIQPGSSGSAVFNNDGKIIGVVFAGMGRDLSYGFIVPQEYLLAFTQIAHRVPWVQVGIIVPDEDELDESVFGKKCREVKFKGPKYDSIKSLCDTLSDSFIWRKP